MARSKSCPACERNAGRGNAQASNDNEPIKSLGVRAGGPEVGMGNPGGMCRKMIRKDESHLELNLMSVMKDS